MSKLMKSLVIRQAKDLQIRQIEVPGVSEGWVRVKIQYAGICGSDIHYYHDGANGAFAIREPLIPGHELSGTVDHDPSGRLKTGTPVTFHPATFGDMTRGIEDMPHLWPNGAYLGSASTWPHTQGGMCEYIAVRSEMIRVLPEGLSLKRASLSEPLAVGLHAINIAGGVAGKRVLVCGAGPIGLLAAAAAMIEGAEMVTVTDVLDEALERAQLLGVSDTINVLQHDVPEQAYDTVLECSGVPASINAAVNAVRRGGTIVQVGMMGPQPQEIILAPIISKEIRYLGSFRFNDEVDKAIELLKRHDVFETVITHIIEADQAVDAFAIAQDSRRSGKVVIEVW